MVELLYGPVAWVWLRWSVCVWVQLHWAGCNWTNKTTQIRGTGPRPVELDPNL